jgi:hypothetical protein
VARATVKTVPLWGLAQQGRTSTVTAQRHLNLYAELNTEKNSVVFYGTAGTTLFSSVNGDTPIRGWISLPTMFYYVHRGTMYSMDNAGTRTTLGTLNTTTGKVYMAYDGSVIMLVDGTNGYTFTISGATFAQIVDAQFPNGARTCTWLDGQFVVDDGDGSDAFYISPDGTNWDALDFATAESNPDGLVRVFADNGELVLGGALTTEFWGNIGNADFPFAPVKGATIEYGLAARASLCKFNSGLAALMTPASAGKVQVMFLQGYRPTPISTTEVEELINDYATVSDAVAYSYTQDGHPMLQISFPTAGKSWLYDAATSLWSPLEYGLDGERHRGELQINFINQTLISDYENGNIYELDSTVYTDNGTAIARELISRHVFDAVNRVVVDELYVDMETGVGLVSGQGSDPQAMLSISKDNGHTWGAELWTTIGAIGKYLTRVVWRRLGVARDWTFKVRVTDPIPVTFTFGAMRARM